MRIGMNVVIGILLGLAILIPVRLYLKKYATVVKSMKQSEKARVAAVDLLAKSVFEHSKLTHFETKGKLNVTGLDGKNMALSDVLKGRTIVYRISEVFCSECNVAQLPYVKTLKDKLGPNKVLILSSFPNIRALSIFVQANHIEVPTYNIADSSLSFLPMEKGGQSYFFNIDGSGDIGSVFLARKDIPMLSDAYCRWNR